MKLASRIAAVLIMSVASNAGADPRSDATAPRALPETCSIPIWSVGLSGQFAGYAPMLSALVPKFDKIKMYAEGKCPNAIFQRVAKSVHEGLKCLDGLRGPQSDEIALKLRKFISLSDDFVRVRCEDFRDRFRAEAVLATATTPPTVNVDASAYARDFPDGVLFHEFMHLAGYLHPMHLAGPLVGGGGFDNRTVDYSISCQACCFGDSGYLDVPAKWRKTVVNKFCGYCSGRDRATADYQALMREFTDRRDDSATHISHVSFPRRALDEIADPELRKAIAESRAERPDPADSYK